MLGMRDRRWARETGTIWQIGLPTAERSGFLSKKCRCSVISHYVFREISTGKLALCLGNRAHFRGFRARMLEHLIMPKALAFVLKKRKILRRTKRASRVRTQNAVRNGLKSHMFGPKNAPFCCKNANLPNCTCFTRIQGQEGGLTRYIANPKPHIAPNAATVRSRECEELLGHIVRHANHSMTRFSGNRRCREICVGMVSGPCCRLRQQNRADDKWSTPHIYMENISETLKG